MEQRDLLGRIRKLELIARKTYEDLHSGSRRSAFQGRGLSFADIRLYQSGDDVRFIDWNATARTGDTYVKVFEEEKELSLLILLDASASMSSGSVRSKWETGVEVAATLAYSAWQMHARCGLLLFSDKAGHYLEPRLGESHFYHIVHDLLASEPRGTSSHVSAAVTQCLRLLKRRTLCVLISDFRQTDFPRSLKWLGQRHELIGVNLSDSFDVKLPVPGWFPVRDPEDASLRWIGPQIVSEKPGLHAARLEKVFQSAGGSLIQLSTTDQVYLALKRFFQTLRWRRTHAGFRASSGSGKPAEHR